ncbi:MAG: hypothetical protein Q7U83_06855 [Daejeonella sp.]|nr:hypothetical protein [Daejeonella sp.]
MKANHNEAWYKTISKYVVVNISKSKNESKSQRIGLSFFIKISCGKYQ